MLIGRSEMLNTATCESGKQPPNTMFWSAGALAIIATAVSAILPVLIGVWQAQAGLRVDQAGFVAATELLGQVAGTGVFLWASGKWPLRTIAAAGLCVLIVGNVATAASVDFSSLMLARAIGGTGGGLIRALSMMCLAKAMSPGRAFAVYAGAQVTLAAATTAVIPHFINAQEPRLPFLALSLVSMIGFALCPFLPRAPAPSAPGNSPGRTTTPLSALLAIAAVFVFFVGQGALWTYLAPIGEHQSIPASGVSHALTLLNFAGLFGALGVGALAHRVNPRLALTALLAIEALSIVSLFNTHSSFLFIASAGGFYFSWCASFPFQFTIIAHSDATGRASAVVPAADGLGLSGGAALAGAVLPIFGLVSAGWICAVASVIGLACFIVAATLSKQTASKKQLRVKVQAATLER